MVHFFELDEKMFLVDGNSGFIHEIDRIVYDIFLTGYFSRRNKDNSVFEKYSEKTVQEAVGEIESLKENGMLFTELKVERPDIMPDLKSMCLNIAHDCNLSCRYCFASEGDYSTGRKMMSFDTGKKALDYLIEKSGARINLEVDFFGGEPLMNFDVVKKLVEYGRSLEKTNNKKFRFTITTNGLLLNDEIMEFVNKEFENIVFSLDGRKEVHDRIRTDLHGQGSFDRTIEKILFAVKSRKDKLYYIRGTFTSKNIDFSKDYEFLNSYGFREVSIEPVVTDEKNELSLREEMIEQIFREYDKIYYSCKNSKNNNFFHFKMDINGGPCIYKKIAGCGAGVEYIAVTPEGDFYPCHQFVGKNEYIIGSIEKGIEDKSLQRKFYETNITSKKECISCWAKLFCSGGCHANALNSNGSIDIPYKLGCEMEKKRIENSIRISANNYLIHK